MFLTSTIQVTPELGHVLATGEPLNPPTQAHEVPVLGVLSLGTELLHLAPHGIVGHIIDVAQEVLAVQDLVALLVDDPALLVHHVVVVEHLLAHGEIYLLDLALGTLDGSADQLGLDGYIRRHVVACHHGGNSVHAIAAEEAHEVVLKREVELGLARIALAAGASAQLVVDASALVALGAHYAEATGLEDALPLGLADLPSLPEGLPPFRLARLSGLLPLLGRTKVALLLTQHVARELVGVAAEDDVRAAAGHVCRYRDGTLTAGLGDDLGLALMVLGIQDLVPALTTFIALTDTAFIKDAREPLGALYRDSAHEHRLAPPMALDDVIGDGGELRVHALVDEVGVVLPDHGLVGRDRLHGQFVDLPELAVLRHSRARHARELVVEAEVVLQRDGGEGLVLLLDEHALLGLDGLVQSLAVAPPLHGTTRELVDYLDLAAHDHVLLVTVKQVLGPERLLEVVDQLTGGIRVQIADIQPPLYLAQALLGCRDGVLGLVHLEVNVRGETANRPREVLVCARRLRTGT